MLKKKLTLKKTIYPLMFVKDHSKCVSYSKIPLLIVKWLSETCCKVQTEKDLINLYFFV